MLTRSHFSPVKGTPEVRIKGQQNERSVRNQQPTNYNALLSTSEMKENKSTIRGRVNHVEKPSYTMDTKDTKLSKNISMKSHYCLEKLKKHGAEYPKKSEKKGHKSKNPVNSDSSKIEPEVKKNENSCDVTFLRKLLAMNKKEELVLNRKLAKLVLEEEFGLKHEPISFHNKLFSNTSVSNFEPKIEKNVRNNVKGNKLAKANNSSEMVIAGKPNNAPKWSLQPQYDLNGRRIYYDSENYEESEDEEITSTARYASESEDENSNPSVKFAAGRSKTYINTTTVIQTKSDITCDSLGRGKIMSSRRNSMTLMNHPVLENKEIRVGRNREEGADDEGKYKKCLFTKVDASSRGLSKDRRESSPGDGVQNVVVHCCEVAPDNISSDSKKKVLKVWNFNEIPKIKPAKLETPVGKHHNVQHMKQSPAISNKDVEGNKDEGRTRIASAAQNTTRKQRSRSNTVR